MEISTIIPHLEAIVFASDKPKSAQELLELLNNALGLMEYRATLDQIEIALAAIKEKYDSEFFPFEVKQSGGGWQFLTKPYFHKTVAQLNGDKFMKKLSTAALETLAIVAYKQPITKGEIEHIRGVNCDYAMQKLLEKELVIITGRKEDAPGQPLIYATSKSFMDYFGINNVTELPSLSDVVPQKVIQPTSVGAARPVEQDLPFPDPDLTDGTAILVDAYGKMVEVGDKTILNDENVADSSSSLPNNFTTTGSDNENALAENTSNEVPPTEPDAP